MVGPVRESTGPHPSPSADSVSGETGGCPTPLDWRQVVSAFREERQLHEWSFDGRRTAVWTLGEGPPLYLLSGFLGDASLFALLVWLLREEHTCVLCDWSSISIDAAEDAGRQLATVAERVLRVADSLGHETFALHGTTYGCLAGLQLMLDAPHRVVRASLQGGFAARRMSVTEKALLAFARRSGRTMGRFKTVAAIQQQNHRRWFPPFDSTRWEFYRDQMSDTPVRDVAGRATIAGQVDLRPQLAEIDTPVLVIRSEGDGRVATEAQHDMARRLPNGIVECLDHCGSLPHLTHPHRLAKLLRMFRDDPSCMGPSC